jgi:hypothetical protein
MTTGLDPAMTLGCGGSGGNITSDNIGPRHLLNIKRLAYEVRPVNAPATGRPLEAGRPASLPRVAALAPTNELDAPTMRQHMPALATSSGSAANRTDAPAEAQAVAPFVCEADVADALKAGRKILVGERTIITPSARDLGESRRVFVHYGVRS